MIILTRKKNIYTKMELLRKFNTNYIADALGPDIEKIVKYAGNDQFRLGSLLSSQFFS